MRLARVRNPCPGDNIGCLHCKFRVVSWSWPQQLSWTGATIQSDEDHKGFEKWWIEAAFLAFGKIRTEEQRKRSHHAPVNVFVVSAGGGIMEAADALLPSVKGRIGRHYERQHLSGILLKYRHRQPLAAEFVSRCGMAAAPQTLLQQQRQVLAVVARTPPARARQPAAVRADQRSHVHAARGRSR